MHIHEEKKFKLVNMELYLAHCFFSSRCDSLYNGCWKENKYGRNQKNIKSWLLLPTQLLFSLREGDEVCSKHKIASK